MKEWQIYYSLEPWGYHEQDDQAAYTRKTFSEAQGAKRKDGKALEMKDFSLAHMRTTSRKKGGRTQTVEEQAEILKALAASAKQKAGE